MKRLLPLFILPVLLAFDLHATATNTRLLRFGLPNDISHLDQTKPMLAQAKYLLTLIYVPLVRANANQELEPALSKSWRIEKDKGLAIFTIAQGHKFSDGSAVTANDVVTAIKELCSPESDAKKELTAIKNCGSKGVFVKASDNNTIEIQFEGPAPILLYQLAGFRAGIVKKKDNLLLGSGPYKIDSHSNKLLKLLPNEYFHDRHVVNNSGLEFIRVGEVNVRELVREQSLDGTIMFRIDNMDTPAEGFRFIDDQANVTMTLIPNLRRRPFSDDDFRKSLMNILNNNHGFTKCSPITRPAQGLIPNGLGGSITHLTIDKLKTKSSVEEIVRRNKGLSIQIHRHIGRRNNCEEKLVLSAFESLGVTATMKYHDEYNTLLPLYRNHNLDVFLELYIFANREAMTIFRKFEIDGENLANMSSSAIEKGMGKVWNSKSISDRFSNYRLLNQEMHNRAYVFPLYYLNNRNMISNCIEKVSDDFAFNPFFGLSQLSIKKGCK